MAIPQAWMMAVAGTVLVALALATGPAAGAYTPIFARGEDGVDCYRAPALVQTSNGTLVAFAEARSACHGDHKAPRSIVCRRSFDMGANWGAISPVAGSGVSGDVASSPTALYNPDLDLVFLQYTLDGANEQITSSAPPCRVVARGCGKKEKGGGGGGAVRVSVCRRPPRSCGNDCLSVEG